MGLYSWAGVGTGGGASTAGSTAKVEIFQDPGLYDGSAAKFEEWWTKMNTWLECHPKQFMEKDVQGHEVPALKPCMYTLACTQSYLVSNAPKVPTTWKWS